MGPLAVSSNSSRPSKPPILNLKGGTTNHTSADSTKALDYFGEASKSLSLPSIPGGSLGSLLSTDK